MPLLPMSTLLNQARAGGYALGYFEAWDGYSLEAVLEAAEEEASPVILGFGGSMIAPSWLDDAGVAFYGAMGRTLAERSRVPVCLLLNEVPTYEHARIGMEAGFNAVMLENDGLPRDELIAQTQYLVREAHARGVAVEAQLGTLPTATQEGIDRSHAELTDPEEAFSFVVSTGVDCLSVVIGNVHLLTGGTSPIDLSHLATIHRKISVPLVIHGGSSFPSGAVRKAIENGVAKFNVGTVLKMVFWEGLQQAINQTPTKVNVHKVLGSHAESDVMVAGKVRMKAKVKELMSLYGSCGKA